MSDNQPTASATACCARAVENTNLVECMVKALHCHWYIPFGDGKFCGHPCNNLIAKGIPPEDWPADAPRVS